MHTQESIVCGDEPDAVTVGYNEAEKGAPFYIEIKAADAEPQRHNLTPQEFEAFKDSVNRALYRFNVKLNKQSTTKTS